MSERLFAVISVGHDEGVDYPTWLASQLAAARVVVESIVPEDGQLVARGAWGGMPCEARHYDDWAGRPLIVSFTPEDFAAGMAAPPEPSVYEKDLTLPPPLGAFVDMSIWHGKALGVGFLASVPRNRRGIEEFLTELHVEDGDTTSGTIELECAAFYVGSFALTLWGNEMPFIQRLDNIKFHSGAVYLPEDSLSLSPGFRECMSFYPANSAVGE